MFESCPVYTSANLFRLAQFSRSWVISGQACWILRESLLGEMGTGAQGMTIIIVSGDRSTFDISVGTDGLTWITWHYPSR